MKKIILAITISLSSLASFAKTTTVPFNKINFENKAISCSLGDDRNDRTELYLEFKESSFGWLYQEKRTFSCTGERCREEHNVVDAKCDRWEYDEDQAYLECNMNGQFTVLDIDLATAVLNDRVGSKIKMKARLTEKRKTLSDVTHQAECQIDL